ncbi:MFS transporter [Stackebrandtia albiflava]|uniref:MFS transporter n=1 Tax=Stackebrandtia albiflava TaxID=406432 RepID=A0A562V294_9ACTN|nr:MFS transporter [Stackebrandtia albiflava]TWJ11953.1 MFS transporter [Stackebrandtia albiflava]
MSATPLDPSAPVPSVPLRLNRGFSVLCAHRVVSALTRSVADVACPIVVFDLTGSMAYAGMLAAAQLLVTAGMMLPAGTMAGRGGWRWIATTADMARGGMFVGVAVSLTTGVGDAWFVSAAALVNAVAGALLRPYLDDAVTTSVPTSQASVARARIRSRVLAAALAGMPLGGALLVWGGAVPFLFAGVAYLVAASALASVRRPVAATGRARPGFRDVRAGVRLLLSSSYPASMFGYAMFVNVTLASLPLALIAALHGYGAGPALIGVLLVPSGVAGICGSLAGPRIVARVRPERVMLSTAFTLPLLAALIGVLPGRYPTAAMVAVLVFAVAPFNVLFLTFVTGAVPPELRAEVSVATRFVARLTQPLGPLLAGFGVAIFGDLWTFLFIAAAGLLAAPMLLSRHIGFIRTVAR